MIIIGVAGETRVVDDGNGSPHSCNSEVSGCEDGVKVGRHLRMFFQKMAGIFPLDGIRQRYYGNGNKMEGRLNGRDFIWSESYCARPRRSDQ